MRTWRLWTEYWKKWRALAVIWTLRGAMVDQLQFAWITLVAFRYLSSDYHDRCRGKREAEIRTLTDLRNRQPVQELGIRLASYVDPKAL